MIEMEIEIGSRSHSDPETTSIKNPPKKKIHAARAPTSIFKAKDRKAAPKTQID